MSSLNVFERVKSFVVKTFTGNMPPNEVFEISVTHLKNSEQIWLDDCLFLYKEGDLYFIVYKTEASKLYNLVRLRTREEATTMFSRMCVSLLPLCHAVPDKMADKAIMQMYVEALETNPTWSCAHFAAKLGLVSAFKHYAVSRYLNSLDPVTNASPILIAIETNSLPCVQELLLCNVQLNLADRRGENVFHWAAKCSNPDIIQQFENLAARDKYCLNQLNVEGESALHLACQNNRPQNVEVLLRWGADPKLTMCHRFPAHCCMKIEALECLQVLLKWSRDQVNMVDRKYGGSLLHWARSKEAVLLIAKYVKELNPRNKDGETPLHTAIRKERHDVVMTLLIQGVKAEIANDQGENALHIAIATDSYELVQALIVFGAEVNYMNICGHTPRHIASLHKGENRPYILHLLHRVGASRCSSDVTGCSDGCDANGTFNGSPRTPEVSTPEHHKKVLDDVMNEEVMKAAISRSSSVNSIGKMEKSPSVESTTAKAGERILCLDGGGIRGLILIQFLMALERITGQPVKNLFDWIGGTSTGGMLALGICYNFPLKKIQNLYFHLKDDVFVGSRPYNSEKMENILREMFGEHTRMMEITEPKVLVTGVLGDRSPAELHFFRNYEPPGIDYNMMRRNSQFEMPPSPHEQLTWRAARSSGAAPTYFRAFGRFLDGGLISNNPTLDILTEVHEYQTGLKATGRGSEVRPIHVVVSLGTGRLPARPVNAVDVYKPEGLVDIYRSAIGAKNLAELIVEAATQSEGRPVERARAWCSMISVPYFRLSPQLSTEIPLDMTSDPDLVNMLWETKVYIHEHWGRLEQLATLLCPDSVDGAPGRVCSTS